jgi:hypothetical protein
MLGREVASHNLAQSTKVLPYTENLSTLQKKNEMLRNLSESQFKPMKGVKSVVASFYKKQL